MNLAANLKSVQDRIAAACGRVGRDPGEVTLIAVTKFVTPIEIVELYNLGHRDFGENRVQVGVEHKTDSNATDARWHLIGHLQRNKAADALAGGFHIIHSVESDKLLDVLDKECGKQGIRAQIFLEVNVAGEESKYGLTPAALPELARKAVKAEHLDVIGLMTMAPFTDDPETSRPVFRELRRLRDELRDKEGIDLQHLSMGMTGDFEVAVEEGATVLRVGTALFQ